MPFLGDVCVVHQICHAEVRRLAAAASDPSVEALVRSLADRYPATPGDAIARVVKTGRAELLEHAAIFGPDAPERLAGHAMAVPLKARGRITGALAFASLDPARRFEPSDLLLAQDFARRAAMALDNARLSENLARSPARCRRACCRRGCRRSTGWSSRRASGRPATAA